MRSLLTFISFAFVALFGVACDGHAVEKSSKEEWVSFLAEYPEPSWDVIVERFDSSLQKPNMSSSLAFETFYLDQGLIRVFGGGMTLSSDGVSAVHYYPPNNGANTMTKHLGDYEVLYERKKTIEAVE